MTNLIFSLCLGLGAVAGFRNDPLLADAAVKVPPAEKGRATPAKKAAKPKVPKKPKKPANAKKPEVDAGKKPSDGKPDEVSIVCPSKLPAIPVVSRSDVYKNTPYKQGEIAEYEVRYMGALAGTGTMEVKRPYKYKGPYKKSIWHRNFHAEAKTGDWYKLIFVAHDHLDALVRPWDYGISRFYMEQDEGQMFGKRLQQKKWIDFDHNRCKVTFRREKKGKKDRTDTVDLAYGAMDTLGVAYWLREQSYELNKKIRTLVYSSEKNWWLEATPTAFEEITVKAGKFKAVKLNLQTYIGEDLQQKGDVDVWIATDTPERQLLQVNAEIKVGSVWVELSKFIPGK